MKKLRELWARRPRLGRRQKILCDLVLAALFGSWLWALAGYPLPTDQMRVRRLERQSLAEPTEIILNINQDQPQNQYIGLGDGYAVSVWLHPFRDMGDQMDVWRLEDQPGDIKLIPIRSFFVDWREVDWRGSWDDCGIAVPELPEGTDRAEMTVWEDGVAYHNEGTWEQPGAWLFAFENKKEGGFGDRWLRGLPYQLTAYDADGAVLAQQAGTVPEL